MTATGPDALGAHHDVVVVGAGSAGCVLAARLSEDPDRSVLVLEAGPAYLDEASYPAELQDERRFPLNELWVYDGFQFRGDPTIEPVIRGRVMGGSGAVNGMIWQRGLPEDYDGWGVPGWDAAAMGVAFARLEDDGSPDGIPGPVPIRRLGREHWAPAHAAFYDAVRDMGVPESIDPRRAESQGLGATFRNSEGGRRMGAAMTHLLPALSRPNLTVVGDAQVTRVLFEERCAVGVEVAVGGSTVRVTADEIVLSAGAVETPQLLTHSGIADAALLEDLGIEQVADLPGVGRNLSDHPSVVLPVRLRPEIGEWDVRCLVGLLHTTATAAAAGRRSDVLMLAFSGPEVPYHNGGETAGADERTGVYAILNAILLGQDAVGHVEVVSSDPQRRPRIHYDYLRSADDRARLREAVRLAGRIFGHPRFAEMIDDDSTFADAAVLEDDRRLDAWVRPVAHTNLHGCGTCRMGGDDDPGAVVDARCRVRGVRGLRVVDLSIVPRVPTAATNATAMAVGERAAQWFEESATADSRPAERPAGRRSRAARDAPPGAGQLVASDDRLLG